MSRIGKMGRIASILNILAREQIIVLGTFDTTPQICGFEQMNGGSGACFSTHTKKTQNTRGRTVTANAATKTPMRPTSVVCEKRL